MMNYKEISSKLKGDITYYSAQLENLNVNSEVTVGGLVENVFDPREFLSEEELKKEKEHKNVDKSVIQLLVDDGLGRFNILLLEQIYDGYKEDIQKDNLIIADGLVVKDNNIEDGQYKSVFAYEVKKIGEIS